jgi:hypothetical protein
MISDNPCSNPEQQIQDHRRHIGSRRDLPGGGADNPHFPTRLLFFILDGFPATDGTRFLMLDDWTCRFSHISIHSLGS